MNDLYGPKTVYTTGSPYEDQEEPEPRTLNPAAWSTRDPGPRRNYAHRLTGYHQTDEWEPPLDLTLPCFEWPLSTDLPREAAAALAYMPPWITWEPLDRVGRKFWQHRTMPKNGRQVLVPARTARTSTRHPRSKAKNPAPLGRTMDGKPPAPGAQ